MTTIRQRGEGEGLSVGLLTAAAVTCAGRLALGAVSDPRFAMAQ